MLSSKDPGPNYSVLEDGPKYDVSQNNSVIGSFLHIREA